MLNFDRFTVNYVLIMIATSGFLPALDCIKFVFGRDSAPNPAGGAYSATHIPPSWFKGRGTLLLSERGEKVQEEKTGKGVEMMGR